MMHAFADVTGTGGAHLPGHTSCVRVTVGRQVRFGSARVGVDEDLAGDGLDLIGRVEVPAGGGLVADGSADTGAGQSAVAMAAVPASGVLENGLATLDRKTSWLALGLATLTVCSTCRSSPQKRSLAIPVSSDTR